MWASRPKEIVSRQRTRIKTLHREKPKEGKREGGRKETGKGGEGRDRSRHKSGEKGRGRGKERKGLEKRGKREGRKEEGEADKRDSKWAKEEREGRTEVKEKRVSKPKFKECRKES